MSESTAARSASKVIAAVNCVGLFGVSYGIFTYSPEDRPWWLTGLAFLASILSFGALLELFKRSPKGIAAPMTASRGSRADELTEHENDVIGRYGAILERRKGLVGKESDLPAPVDELRHILVKAQRDPLFQLAPAAVARCLRMLDTYVPDEEFEGAVPIAASAFDRIAARDESGFNRACAAASARQQMALRAIAATMRESVRQSDGPSKPPGA